MARRKTIAKTLAAAFLAGPFEPVEAARRGATVVKPPNRWVKSLAASVVRHFGPGSRPVRSRVAAFILTHPRFHAACERSFPVLVENIHWPAEMRPADGPPGTWSLPAITTPSELASKLNLTDGELRWFADCHSLESKLPEGKLRHYRYRWVKKPTGAYRLVESPKQRLKAIQKWILHEILDHVPPHASAHGFRKGCSIKTFVAPHSGRPGVLRLDLKDFFPSVKRSRVMAIFLALGYPEAVARLLTGLCTNTTPSSVLKSCPDVESSTKGWAGTFGRVHRFLTRSPSTSTSTPGPEGAALLQLKELFANPHLPQGAPTSPALANLSAYRLDLRLAALASSLDPAAAYTRYADDLVLSGDASFLRCAERLAVTIGAIALEEGFEVQTRKTRLMRQSTRQKAGGLVLNAKPNVARPSFDRLKAILHNCVRHGPAGQNRSNHPHFRQHLEGKVAFVEQIHPQHGQKLRDLFNRIAWPA